KWSEAHGVQAGVICEVDEELCRSAVRRGTLGKRHITAKIALLHFLVGDVGIFPVFLNTGIPIDSELHNKASYDAEESAFVIESVLDQIVEAASADRRPVRVHFDDEHSCSRIELCFESIRGAFV